MRDEFSQSTKDLLANRVGWKCSNPKCRHMTRGAGDNKEKFINIGVAAHICAATNGGPRFNKDMTSEERKSYHNGIWLCQNCAKLIDSDVKKYTVDLLNNWKINAEKIAGQELEDKCTTKEEPEEKILAIKLIDFLEGKRVLYNDCRYGCENCKERSSKSVLEIKSFTTKMLYNLSKETDFKKAVKDIRQQSNEFLNDVTFEEAYNNIIYARNKYSCPILKYRMEMAEHILKIMNMFDITEVGSLFYLLQEYIK